MAMQFAFSVAVYAWIGPYKTCCRSGRCREPRPRSICRPSENSSRHDLYPRRTNSPVQHYFTVLPVIKSTRQQAQPRQPRFHVQPEHPTQISPNPGRGSPTRDPFPGPYRLPVSSRTHCHRQPDLHGLLFSMKNPPTPNVPAL